MNHLKNDSSPLISGANKAGFFYGYIIVAASFLILMIAWGSQYSFGIFFKPMLAEFGFSRAVLSGAYSINMIIQAAACIFIGKLSDRYGPRLVVTLCGTLLGISYLLMSQAQMLWHIYLLFGVVASIGLAGMWVPLLSTIAKWFVSGRGLMCGIAAAGIGIGIIFVPPLTSFFIAGFGWRTSYVIIGTALLILIILSAQALKRDPAKIGLSALGMSEQHEEDNPSFTFPEAVRSRQFWMISGVFLVMNICVHSVMVHIVPHATDVGIADATAAVILSVIGVASIISKLVVGAALDRLGNKTVVIIIVSLMLISLIFIQFSNALWVFYVFAVFFAFAYGGFAASQSPYIAYLFGLKHHGTIFGFSSFIFMGSAAFGPLIAGKIFDVTSSYNYVFILLSVLSVLAILFACGIKKTGRGTPINH